MDPFIHCMRTGIPTNVSRCAPDESVNISFEDIFKICSFEVQNAFMILNGVIFLQKRGCPQGGVGLPGSTMTVCLFYEHQFRCSIYDYLAFI